MQFNNAIHMILDRNFCSKQNTSYITLIDELLELLSSCVLFRI